MNIQSSINFNVILNILMYDFYGKSFDLIINFTCEEFIEILGILQFFCAKEYIISHLIIMYTNKHDIPFEMLNNICLSDIIIQDRLKQEVLNKLNQIISNSPIIIQKEFKYYIFDMFQIKFNDNDINTLKRILSDKLFNTYNKKLLINDDPYSILYCVLKSMVDSNKKIGAYSLFTWGRGEKFFNESLNENGFDLIFKTTFKQQNNAHLVNVTIDDTLLFNYEYGPEPCNKKFAIFDIISDYLVNNKIFNKQ